MTMSKTLSIAVICVSADCSRIALKDEIKFETNPDWSPSGQVYFKFLDDNPKTLHGISSWDITFISNICL